MNKQINNFFDKQLVVWDFARENVNALDAVLNRKFPMNGFEFILQCNPKRIISSTAKTDAKSIQERKCFLCRQNLPKEQICLEYSPDYSILVNPYPIFPKHSTIPSNTHSEQLVKSRMLVMLQLAKDLNDFSILYNGAQCGASAPDHFHFQAIPSNKVPVEKELDTFPRKILIGEKESVRFYEMNQYLRKTLVLESDDSKQLNRNFDLVYALLQTDKNEPMFNIIALYRNNEWKLIVFPREKHRPTQYFEEDEKQILFSPGVVDFGGTLIIPRKEDYDKMTVALVADMLSQLTLSDEKWTVFLTKLKHAIG